MTLVAEPVEYRVLPHNLDAERAVLGAIMLHSERLEHVAGTLQAEHFYRLAHQTIYVHMLKLAEQRVAIDFLTLRDSLATAGELENAGGPAYLMKLVDGLPSATNLAHHAEIVRERASLRGLISEAHTLLDRAYSAEDSAKDVIDAAEQAIFKISQGESQGGFRRLSEIVPEALDQIERWSQSRQSVSGVPSGFTDLDALTRGFQPGNLIILAARPGMGKSSLAMNIAKHAAKLNYSVGMFSLEMSDIELVTRTITDEAGIDGHRLKSGYLGARDWSSIAAALESLTQVNLFIDEDPFITAFEMRARARRLKSQHGLDLLIVDYTQLITTHQKHQRENRTQELSAITRALKGLAKDLKIPVIALSQLSRDIEKRATKRPVLSDLRESGSLEQDADVVLFIFREEGHESAPANRDTAEIIIAKHRNGPPGTVRVGWIPEQTKFVNLNQDAYVGSLPNGDR